jgi:hypothetical protein
MTRAETYWNVVVLGSKEETEATQHVQRAQLISPCLPPRSLKAKFCRHNHSRPPDESKKLPPQPKVEAMKLGQEGTRRFDPGRKEVISPYQSRKGIKHVSCTRGQHAQSTGNNKKTTQSGPMRVFDTTSTRKATIEPREQCPPDSRANNHVTKFRPSKAGITQRP